VDQLERPRPAPGLVDSARRRPDHLEQELDVLGLEVPPDAPRGLGPAKEGREGREERPAPPPDGRLGQRTRGEQVDQAEVLPLEGDGSPEEPDERVRSVPGPPGELGELGQVVVGDRLDQGLARGEAPVERSLADPRPPGDLAERGVESLLGEDLARGQEQGVPVAPGVGPEVGLVGDRRHGSEHTAPLSSIRTMLSGPSGGPSAKGIA
jgi:hypothetical protein